MLNMHFFLHGLDSSGKGSKGRFFSTHFPYIQCPDFTGELDDRLHQLENLCGTRSDFCFIGSSFGGLMATIFAIKNPHRVANLFLLAPALNFPGYHPPRKKIDVRTFILIGEHDEVTPVDPVVNLAENSFSNLVVKIVNDDHFLHKTFQNQNWQKMLNREKTG